MPDLIFPHFAFPFSAEELVICGTRPALSAGFILESGKLWCRRITGEFYDTMVSGSRRMWGGCGFVTGVFSRQVRLEWVVVV